MLSFLIGIAFIVFLHAYTKSSNGRMLGEKVMEAWLKEKLYQAYKMEVLEIVPFYHLWKATSVQGEWIIKGYKNKFSQIQWLYHLTKEVRIKGFKQLAEIIPNSYGFPWFGTSKNAYVLMPFIEGKRANYLHMDDVEKVVQSIASFHHHAGWLDIKFLPPEHSSLKSKLENRLIQFTIIYQQVLQKKRKDQLDKIILYLGKDMIKFAENALNQITFSLVNRLQQEAKEHQMVAHGDVANHNFILGEKPWIIDLDIASYDAQFLDLWQLLNRSMLHWKWDLERFYQIENTYLAYRKLKDSEKILIRQLSLFPNDFFRESIGAYKFPEKYKRKQSVNMLLIFINHYHSYLAFQKDIYDIINKT